MKLTKDSVPDSFTRYFTPTVDQISSALQKLAVEFSYVYVVVDALDECEKKQDLFEILDKILKLTTPPISLLVTGRKLKEIEDHFSDRGELISIDSSKNSDDIGVYIRSRIESDVKLKRWPESVRSDIETLLADGADGMSVIP